MVFTNVGYAVFLAALAALYYVLPKKWQNGVLLAGGAVFYLCGVPRASLWRAVLPVAVLCLSVLFIYCMARAIERAGGKKRAALTGVSVAVCVAVLCFFKYANFFIPTLLGASSWAGVALPLGISFYTFAAVSYLVDVARGDMAAAKGLVPFAAYLTFFATITSGPICRAKQLLPQLEKPRGFSAQRACDAFRLALFGYFKWVAAANVLGLYVNVIFENMADYSGFTLLFAAALYALQLYFEFSGYSDVARASALLLGVDIPVNFKTPYFATNFSGFWSRWHITLSTWLQDYIFTPLVWGRWTSRIPVLGKRLQAPPVLSSLAVVFIISGFWHGNTLPFVVWGCLQAAYRIGEELLHRFYKKPAKKPGLPLRVFKTAGVFCLWSVSLVFFRVGLLENASVGGALSYLARSVQNLSLSAFAADTVAAVETGFYAKPMMVAAYFAFILLVISVAIYTDWLQCFRYKDAHISTVLARQSTAVRWAVYYALIGCIFAGYIMQSGGFGTVSFAYANF